jgi:hypothetical protein
LGKYPFFINYLPKAREEPYSHFHPWIGLVADKIYI